MELLLFSHNLKAYRIYRGLTQASLGEKSGLGNTHISHLEAGRRKPDVDTLQALAKALGVSTGRLLGPDVVPGRKRSVNA